MYILVTFNIIISMFLLLNKESDSAKNKARLLNLSKKCSDYCSLKVNGSRAYCVLNYKSFFRPFPLLCSEVC